MSDYFPWDDIQEGNVFPGGIFRMEVIEIADGESNNGKRMPKGRFKCIEPKEYAGKMYFDQYVCGTDEQMQDFVAGSWGCQTLKSIFKNAQVPKGTSFLELMANSTGNQLMIHLGEPYTDDFGLKNKVVAYYKVGEREAGLTAGSKKVATQAKVKMPSAPPKAEAPAKKPSMITCTVCSQEVPVKDFGEHVASCTG